VNAEFCTGVMDPLLKRTQRVRPAAFCSWDFTCCTITRPPTKLRVFANFWPAKMLQSFITPRSPDLSPPDCFLFPKLKMKLTRLHFADVVEIQETATERRPLYLKAQSVPRCQHFSCRL
jgi:hypothetical protein